MTKAGSIIQMISESEIQMKKGFTYTVYQFDPRSNEYAYLIAYHDAVENDTLSTFKARVAKKHGSNPSQLFVFTKPVSRDEKNVKAVGE